MFTKWWEMPVKNIKPFRQYFFTVFLLFLFWMLLSGSFAIKNIIYGVITSLVSAWVCMPLLMVPENEERKVRYFIFDFSLVKAILFIPWILKELFLANIDVVKAELSPALAIDPKIVRFKYFVKNPIAKSLLANAITLTPGTVTLNITDDNIYEVHALTKTSAQGLLSGNMQHKIADIFREEGKIEIVEDIDS